jgi:hypothetical protein
MNSINRKTGLFLIIFSVLIINFCKKEEVPKTLLCKVCQQNTFDSGGNILTTGIDTEYCDTSLLRIEATPAVIVNGIKTKWVCN